MKGKPKNNVILCVVLKRYTTQSALHKKRIAVKLLAYTHKDNSVTYGIAWSYRCKNIMGFSYTNLEKATEQFETQHKRDSRQDPNTSVIKSGSDWKVIESEIR